MFGYVHRRLSTCAKSSSTNVRGYLPVFFASTSRDWLQFGYICAKNSASRSDPQRHKKARNSRRRREIEKAEGTGFETASNSEVNDNTCCIYVNCQKGCAANALHSDFLKSLEVALKDTDLQNILGSWERLPNEIRNAIVVLIKANEIKKEL
jgi:hypothetical protein